MSVGELPPITAPPRGDHFRSSPIVRFADAGGRFLRSRRGQVFLATAIVVGAAALNWSWLVAVGLAPVLLAVLPCLGMCALGLCMKGSGSETGASCRENKRHLPSNPPSGSDPAI